MILRDYQEQCVGAVVHGWVTEPGARLVVKLPTGSGKTVIFAALAEQMARGANRVVVLTNRDELVKQTVDKLSAVAPGERIGVVQGDRDDWRPRMVVASVQTISRQARLDRIPVDRFRVIICDEMQYSAAPSWQRVLEHFGALDRAAGRFLVGFSATPERQGGGLGDTWDRVVFERDTWWAIEQGFLVAPTGFRSNIADLDLSGVKTSRGDYQDAALATALKQAHAAEQVALAYRDVASGPDGLPRRGIIFAPTVDAAQEFADAFNAAGIATETIYGTTAIAERQGAYRRVKSGVTRVLASVMVLAVGFDLPCVEVAVMARPTKSRSLYVQQAGRVLRLSPETGKDAALILDVVGVTTLGLACFADLSTTKPKVERGAVERLPTGAPTPRPMTVNGCIDLRPVELFPGQPKRRQGGRQGGVLMTYGGIPFVAPTEDFPATLFALEGGDGWAGWAIVGRGNPTVMCAGPLEAVLADLAQWNPGKPPSWGKEPCTQLQRDYVAYIKPPAHVDFKFKRGMSMREASDLISVDKASKLLDRRYPDRRLK